MDDDFDAGGDDEPRRPPAAAAKKGEKPKAGEKPKTEKAKPKAGKTSRRQVPEEDNYFAGSEEETEDELADASTDKKLSGAKAKIWTPPPRTIVTFGPQGRSTDPKANKLDKRKALNRSRLTDNLIKHMVRETKKKYGNGAVMVGRDTDQLIVGIPMFAGRGPTGLMYPGCLGLEYVFCMDIFPLGLVIQLVAKTGVGKSGFLAEIGRWFHMAGGYFNLCECETKFNPEWYRSIMGRDIFDNEVLLDRCSSVEDWQRKNTFGIHEAKRFMTGTKTEPGPGRTFPWLFGVDSIMGKSSEITQEGILGKVSEATGERGTTGTGAAGRGFPIEALIITRYMRSIPGELDNWPFSMVLINHLRIKQDAMGNEERSKAGGEQVGFQESFEVELSKVGGHKKKIESVNFEGFPVQISCEKNSFGPTHRRCQTRVLWMDTIDENTGERIEKTFWDWDWTTVHLLNWMLSDKGNPRIKHSLKNELGFHLACPSTSDIENRAWSRTLGMTEKDACPWSELGALIRQDQKLMDELRMALRITKRPYMGGSYQDQLNELAKKLP